MAAETVVTIADSATGAAESHFMEIVEWIRWWDADPVHRAFLKHEEALAFFRGIPAQTRAWIERIRFVKEAVPEYLETLTANARGGFAFEAATARMAAQEAFIRHAALNAAAEAAEGTLVAGTGTTVAAVVVPVVAMVAVQAALGAGYYQARQQAKKEGYAMGFAKGFITGLLQWEARFTIDRFWDNAVNQNPYDEQLPTIRANAHNEALIHGRVAGLAKKDADKKNYLLGLRKLTHASAAGWTPRSDDWLERERARQVQLSYVIALATAAMKHKIIKAE